MTGLISGYRGDVCQLVVYNRTGMRAFNTVITPSSSVTPDKWVAIVAPLTIAAAYLLIVIKRGIAAAG
jgi:hypothetical protein